MPDLPDWLQSLGWTNELLAAALPLGIGATRNLAVQQYASLLVVTNSADGVTTNTVLKTQVHQAATVGGSGDTTPYDDYLTSIDALARTSEWLVPVRGGSVRLTNAGAGTQNVVVYGSNRQIDNLEMVGEQATARRLVITGALTAATPAVFGSGDAGPDSTVFNGPVKIIADTSLPAGVIRMRMCASDGTSRFPRVGHGTGVDQVFDWFHPKMRCMWDFVPDANAGAATRIMTIIPGQT